MKLKSTYRGGNRLFEQMQSLAQVGLWEFDLLQESLYLSNEARRIAGVEPGASEIHEHHPFVTTLRMLMAGNEAFKKEMPLELANGTQQYVLVSGQPRRQRNQLTGWWGVLQDIDAQKKRELSLVDAKERAEALTHAKSEFLSNMSHEIRTPLNAIIGLTDMLLQEDIKPQIQENIQMIKYSSDNLLVLINDILDFSKIEAGKISFEHVEFDVYQLISDFNKTIDFKAREKGLDLDLHIHPQVPRVLIGDPYRLNQMLLNLASNALKFTQAGTITVRVHVLDRAEEQIRVSFAVQDTGIGIPEEDQHKIFEQFVQASAATTRQFGGTGLGLAITRRLVDLQGGTIQLKSKLGIGSTFTIELPFQVSAKVALEESGPALPADRKDLSGLHLLLVEDNGLNQLVAKRLINRWQAELDIAGNGTEALELLSRKSYDVILMDIHLPGMNGYELTRLIRNNDSQPTIAIIALTADAFPDTKEKTRLAGMDDVILKPFDQDVFYKTIVRNLRPQEKYRHLQERFAKK